ncbi:MAG: glyoxalase, partial [Betaproteobacteria bacterium]
MLGAQPVRILDDRVTFSFGGVLQLVCHLERRAIDPSPRAYPRHFGLTFLKMEDFTRMHNHIEK